MNTVDALNVLGKALCGDSFKVKPGLTDAETILEIAKNYTGGSGSGGGGSESGGGGSKEEFDLKAFCQEWSPIMAAEQPTPEDQMAFMQAINEIPQNIYIYCSGSSGSGPIVADEDYGDYFLPILRSIVAMGLRSVTLVADMSVEGAEGFEPRTYIGPLFLDNNSVGSHPMYYELKPASGQWCSRIYSQDGREFIQEAIKFLEWEADEGSK